MCDEILPGNNTLKNHMLFVHKSPKNFKCIYCGELFCLRSEYKDHMFKDHEGLKFKKCKCAICDKIVSVNNLRHHIKVLHEGLKDYKCHICDMDFAHASGLKNHMSHNHKDQLNIYEAKKVYPEDTNDDLDNLPNCVVSPEKIINCKTCGETFNQAAEFKIHMRKHIQPTRYN